MIGHSSYRVRLMVNGVAQPEFLLQRRHSLAVADTITLSGSFPIKVKSGDVITVNVFVEPNAEGKRGMYNVLPEGSCLAVERMQVF